MNRDLITLDAPYVPLRSGLFQLEPPGLLGSHCPECDTRTFPARSFCPHCRADGQPRSVLLRPRGHVHALTVIHQAPPGWSTPYTLALVDLIDQVRVMTQLDVPTGSTVTLGEPVSLAFRKFSDRDGLPVVGYVFVKSQDMEKES